MSTTQAASDNATLWNDTAPTSTQWTIGTANNLSGEEYIVYLFADMEGFCKTFYVEGNGNADGSFCHTGHSPEFFFYKRTDAVSNWSAYDTVRNAYNTMNLQILLDSSGAENTTTGGVIDSVSNGLKARGTGGATNASGSDYIGLSIGITSKYSNAR
jgi:hypothetical protein